MMRGREQQRAARARLDVNDVGVPEHREPLARVARASSFGHDGRGLRLVAPEGVHHASVVALNDPWEKTRCSTMPP